MQIQDSLNPKTCPGTQFPSVALVKCQMAGQKGLTRPRAACIVLRLPKATIGARLQLTGGDGGEV